MPPELRPVRLRRVSYVASKNRIVSASHGADHAHRDTGSSDAPPLVALQHFRGNLDNWDPAHGVLFQHHAEFASDVEAVPSGG